MSMHVICYDQSSSETAEELQNKSEKHMIFKKLPKSRRSSALSEDLAGLLAVVSLLLCFSSEVLEMLCSTGTSTGICMIFFRHWTPVVYSRFRVRHWSDTVETLLAYLEWVITAFTNFYTCVTLHGAYSTEYVVCKST